MGSTDGGWRELYTIVPGGTEHPEEQAQRRAHAALDAARRARLPEWEAVLPGAEAAVRETWAAVGAIKARLAEAEAAYTRRYKQVTGARGLRDSVFGLPIVPQDDERCQPELGRKRVLEQELQTAQAEHGQAVARCQALIEELAFIRGTIPAR